MMTLLTWKGLEEFSCIFLIINGLLEKTCMRLNRKMNVIIPEEIMK